jgi:hypothetical protein
MRGRQPQIPLLQLCTIDPWQWLEKLLNCFCVDTVEFIFKSDVRAIFVPWILSCWWSEEYTPHCHNVIYYKREKYLASMANDVKELSLCNKQQQPTKRKEKVSFLFLLFSIRFPFAGCYFTPYCAQETVTGISSKIWRQSCHLDVM